MNIYTKILSATIPLVLLSFLAAGGMSYYLSRNALEILAEEWLDTRGQEALRAAQEQVEFLRAYGLDGIEASVKQAQRDVWHAMSAIEIGEQGFVYVVDSRANIVFHPDPAMIGESVSDQSWFERLSGDAAGRLSYVLNDENHFATYRRFEPWEWYIIATDPEREVYGPVNKMGGYVLILGVAGSIVIGLTLMLLTRRITAPLKALVDGAEEVGKGNLDVRIPVETSDEIGVLARAFNRMTEQLYAYYQSLEQRLATVVAGAPIILFSLDREGRFTLAEGKGMEAIGVSSENLAGESVFDLYADQRDMLTGVRQALTGETVSSTIDVGDFSYEAWYSPLRDENNSVDGVIGVATDVTERKRAEQRLVRQNEYLAALHETTLGLISRLEVSDLLETLIERAGQLLESSHGYIYLAGPTETEIQRKIGVGMFGESIGYALKRGQGVAGKVWETGAPLVVNDYDSWKGRPRDARYAVPIGAIMAVPLKSGDKTMGVLGMAYDVDAKQTFGEDEVEFLQRFGELASLSLDNARLYTAAQEARAEAEQTLTELKATQQNLIHAEKMASLGQLTAGIAHEIKNPLNFVNNFADSSNELLDELKTRLEGPIESLGEDEREDARELFEGLSGFLVKIKEHGQRADGIVKGMLSHARAGVDTGRPTDLNALLEEALNLAYHGARAENPSFNVTLERDLDPNVGELAVYPQEMTRVLLNLIGNGFYATQKRRTEWKEDGYRPTMTVSSRDLGETVEVRVRDNGTGIPTDAVELIFEPFFTTKPTGEGTGLGLSLSYETVVQQHHGRLEVDTREGEFTEFIITLPRDSIGAEAVGEAS
ncbi:MAG: GAF domain-containing protein [Gammaproteobacteria bacterium]|nr:GAF domain-containing protein [Gammaproteobacteria bacterium]